MSSEDCNLEDNFCQRLEPLGASSDDHQNTCASQNIDSNPEDEQECLNMSFLALTSHFAQVQFKLRQVLDAPVEERDRLLTSLENLAFKDIQEIDCLKDSLDKDKMIETFKHCRLTQKKLLRKLASQISEIKKNIREDAAVEEPEIQDNIEKQRALLEVFNTSNIRAIDLDTYKTMKPAAVRQKVAVTLAKMLEPLKSEQDFVENLKLQIEDLEQFIKLLKGIKNKIPECNCKLEEFDVRPMCNEEPSLTNRFLSIINMFFTVYMNCGGFFFNREAVKNDRIPKEWDGMKARLEFAIQRVRSIVMSTKKRKSKSNKITSTILTYLSPSISDLIEHGLVEKTLILPIICSATFASSIKAWSLLISYYQMRNGEDFNAYSMRKLAKSFDLQIEDAMPANDREHLLITLDNIVRLYKDYKCTLDEHFNAFVCSALNNHKLAAYLKVIYQSESLIKKHYLPWSYVANTGFTDSLMKLDSLTELAFDLPVDYAIRDFLNIQHMIT